MDTAHQDQLFPVEPPPPDDEKPPAPVKKPAPRESDGVCAIYLELTGNKYKYQGPKDADAWKRMRAVASIAEIETRWRVGLMASGWLKVSTLAQLDQKWNELGQSLPNTKADVNHPPCFVCAQPAPSWYSKLRLCTGCLGEALKVRAAVPLPEPRCKSPSDSGVQQYQQAADLAVYQWAQSRRGAA